MLLLGRDEELLLHSTDFPMWPTVALLQRIYSEFRLTTFPLPQYIDNIWYDTSYRGEKKKSSLAPRLQSWSLRT